MVPVLLRATNFLSHSDSVVDFSKFDIALVVGAKNGDKSQSNGAGKSSLFVDAITWCLFDKFRGSSTKNITADKIIKYGKDKASVEFIFSINDVLYRVYRERTLKSSNVMFQVKNNGEWKSVSNTLLNVNQTNKIICDFLRLDYSIFSNSIIFGQGFTTAFATATASERKEIISNLLMLNRYDLYEEKAKKYVNDLQNQVDVLKPLVQNIEQIQKEIENTKIEKERKQLELVDLRAEREKIDKKIKELVKQREKINSEALQRKNIIDSIKDIENQIEFLRKDIIDKESKKEKAREIIEIKKREYKDLNEAKQKIIIEDITQLENEEKKVSDEYNKLIESESSLKAVLNNDATKIKDLMAECDRIKQLKIGKCPVCYSNITDANKKDVIQILQNNIASIKSMYLKNKSQYEKIKSDRDNCKKVLDSIRDKIAINRQKDEERKRIEAQINIVKNEGYHQKNVIELLQKEINTQTEQIQQYENDLKLKQRQFESMKDIDYAAKIQDIENKMSDSEFVLRSKDKQIEDLISIISALQKDMDNLNDALKKSIDAENKIKQLQNKIEMYKQLVLAFGKNGIRSFIFENCSIELEETINDLLFRMTNGEMKVDIITQKKNRDGSLSETFDIVISDKYHSDLFDMYSGGEQLRIAIALRIALSKLIAKRAGCQIKFIIFDEATSYLDEDGINKFVSCISAASNIFEKIIIITHQTELKDYFDSVIVVDKNDNGSFLK